MCLTLQSWLEYCVEVFYPSLQQHVLELIEAGLQGYNRPIASCLQLGLHGRLFLSIVFFHLLFPGGEGTTMWEVIREEWLVNTWYIDWLRFFFFFFSLIHWPFLYHLGKKKFVWSWPGQQSGLIFVPSLTITSEFLLFKTRSRKIRFQIQGVSIASLGFFLMQARERSSKVGYLGGPRWHRQSLEAFPEK